MLLENKNAVIFGGGGAIGGAVARRFAQEGAHVFLAGRRLSSLAVVERDIRAGGGAAHTAEVDALNAEDVNAYMDDVAASSGSIDVLMNAVGVDHVQGPPLDELTLGDFMHPITTYLQTNFLTAQAAARHMRAKGSGVILTLTTPGSKMAGVGFLGYGTTCGAVETFSRILSGEVGGDGVRVVCLRPTAIPMSLDQSHLRDVFSKVAVANRLTLDEWLAGMAQASTLRRLPTLDEVADAAAFIASDKGSAMTGAITNLSCGQVGD